MTTLLLRNSHRKVEDYIKFCLSLNFKNQFLQ